MGKIYSLFCLQTYPTTHRRGTYHSAYIVIPCFLPMHLLSENLKVTGKCPQLTPKKPSELLCPLSKFFFSANVPLQRCSAWGKFLQDHQQNTSVCETEQGSCGPCLPHPQPAFCLWKTVSQMISLIRDMTTRGNKGKQSKETR